MEQIKLHWEKREELQLVLGIMVETYDQGACFFMTDREKIIYKVASSRFDVPGTEIGSLNKEGGVADIIIKSGEVRNLHLDKDLYGVRVNIIAGPMWSEDGTIMGVWIMVLPRVHRLAQSFEDFAPILVEMFSEGGLMYISDKEKIINKQGSSKFDVPQLKVGDALDTNSAAVEAIRTRSKAVREESRERWGREGMVTCYPLVDDEQDEVVGVFGLALPRELPLQLKEMASNLGKGLSEVSAAMEEMAASASEVSQNQNSLNNDIERVQQNANEINKVLAFIKEIADETKMLGLNAAIEAARAGEAGRGFGVVAEEIRKLSDQSKQTVVQIKELIDRIHDSINNTKKVSDATLSSTEQEAAATEEVNASIEEMSSMAEQLDNLAAQL